MSGPYINDAHVKELLWLANAPGQWRVPHEYSSVGLSFMGGLSRLIFLDQLVDLGLAEKDKSYGSHKSVYRATTEGLDLAKEMV